MTQDEFVEQHGQEAWDCLVGPLKELTCVCDHCTVYRCNANVLIHISLMNGESPLVTNPHTPGKFVNRMPKGRES